MFTSSFMELRQQTSTLTSKGKELLFSFDHDKCPSYECSSFTGILPASQGMQKFRSLLPYKVRENHCKSKVSTAFVFGNRQGQVKEQLNPMSTEDVENTYSTLLRMNASELNKVAKKLVKESGHPNVYTYTKCLTGKSKKLHES